MKVPRAFVLLAAVLLVACRESMGAPAGVAITTEADGRLNCDGMICPPGDGLMCLVRTSIANEMSTVHRQCVNPAGVVVAELTSSMVPSPGITSGRQSVTAYKKN